MSGFQLYSHGLPGLRTFTAEPDIDIGSLELIPPSGDAADLKRYKADLQAAEQPSVAAGVTVGPVAPPDPIRSSWILFNSRQVPDAICGTGMGY